MASFNRIIMIGNLTKDPDIKAVGSGTVCRLSIASNRQFKNKNSGTVSQEVCFIDVDIWGPQAESSKKYLSKGSPVLIEGRLKYDTWQDADGKNKSKHSITAERVVFLGARQDGVESDEKGDYDKFEFNADQKTAPFEELAGTAPAMPRKSSRRTSSGSSVKEMPPFDDDLPF